MRTRRVADGVKSQAAGAGAWAYDGLVDAVDPARGTVSVTVQPIGIQAEGLPYFTPATAGPWRMIALPAIGSTVKVVSTDPNAVNADSAYVVGAVWDEDDTPPQGYAAGDYLVAHKDGPKLLLKANGEIEHYSDSVKLGDANAIALANERIKPWAEALVLKLNADMALLKAHTNITGSPDPTLVGIGGYDAPAANTITTKVKAT
jgi:hypothetical protein